MAIAKVCDRCGKFYKTYNEQNDVSRPNGFMLLNIDEKGQYYSHGPIDLCPECTDSLNKWMHLAEDEVTDQLESKKIKDMRRELLEHCISLEKCDKCIFQARSSCNFDSLSDADTQTLYKKLMEDEK